MLNVLPLLLFLLTAALPTQAQPPVGENPSDLITVPAGGKFLRWYGYTGRTYFIQVSNTNNPLGKWNWAPVIEAGDDEDISYEVDGTAPKAFFRLKPTDLPIPSGKTIDSADFDNDGISNIDEINVPLPLLASDATDPLNADTDGDTMSDGFERTNGLDPNDDGTTDPDNGLSGDPDDDGLTNAQELALGTDPNNSNSDGDFLNGEPLLDGEDADPKEILVNWKKAPESSYLLVEVAAPVDPTLDYTRDLNDKGEVLFGTGIWDGGNWIPKQAPEITGAFPGSTSAAFPNGIGYEILPGDWDFFNNDRTLLQIGYIRPTEGPGVDSAAPVPVFWPTNQSSASHVYATADLWEDVYWNAWAVGVSTGGEMVTCVSPQHPPTGTTIATERLDRFDAAGTLIGSMDGSGGFHPSVRTSETSMMSGSGWVAARLVRATTATQPAAEKLGLWNATNTLVALPSEADGRAFPVHLTDLPNSKVGLVAGQVTAAGNIERVFLPDAQDQMQYSPRLSAQKLQLFAGDGTAMTSTYEVESDGQTTLKLNLWRNGKLIPLRDLCPAIGEMLDGGYRLNPKKANKHGVYLIEAQGPNEERKVFVAKPVDIVPDDNMAGVVGDVIKSVKAESKIKHFVSPKLTTELPQEYVILKATGVTAGQITSGHPNQIVEWEGGEAVLNEPLKRKVTRAAADIEEVKIKNKTGGAVTAEMHVWIVWSTVTSVNGTPEFLENQVENGSTRYQIQQSPTTVWRFKFEIEPFSICDSNTVDRPNLTGFPKKPVPGENNSHSLNPNRKADSATLKWDVSRQMSVVIRNPNSIPKERLETVYPPAWSGNQPAATDNPIAFPVLASEGNDDSPGDDEDCNPYKKKRGGALGGALGSALDHEIGEITSLDAPRFSIYDRWGSDGYTFTVETNFREFARVELWDGIREGGIFWFRISEQTPWHHYLDARFDSSENRWKNKESSSGDGHPHP